MKDDTIRITLEALPLSQWRQVLEANTVTENGVPKQRIEDICADAIKLMVRKTVPETPVEELANVITELSDGQISPIWYAIRDLRIGWNATRIGASPVTRRKPNGMRPNANGCSRSTNTNTHYAPNAACP